MARTITAQFILVMAALFALTGCGGPSHEEDLAYAEQTFEILDVETVQGASRIKRFATAGGGDPMSNLPARVTQRYELESQVEISEVVVEFVKLAIEDGWTIETQSDTRFETAVRGESAPFFQIRGYENDADFTLVLVHYPTLAPS